MRLLNRSIVESRLKPKNQPVSWLISRIGTRSLQEDVIRFWNEYGSLPGGLDQMPRLAPAAAGSAWRRETL